VQIDQRRHWPRPPQTLRPRQCARSGAVSCLHIALRAGAGCTLRPPLRRARERRRHVCGRVFRSRARRCDWGSDAGGGCKGSSPERSHWRGHGCGRRRRRWRRGSECGGWWRGSPRAASGRTRAQRLPVVFIRRQDLQLLPLPRSPRLPRRDNQQVLPRPPRAGLPVQQSVRAEPPTRPRPPAACDAG
jgi:hypothetical protein